MNSKDQALDRLFIQGTGLFGALWQGYLHHRLLFYRQSGVASPEVLPKIGRELLAARSAAKGAAGVESWIAEIDAKRTLAGARRALRLLPAGGPADVLLAWTELETDAPLARFSPRAVASLQDVVEREGRGAWAALSLGLALESRREYGAAMRALDMAASLRPDWPWPYVIRGVVRWYYSQIRESVGDFKRALALDPRLDIAYMLMGRARADLGDRAMLEDLDAAIRLFRGSGVYYSWRGHAHMLLGRVRAAHRDLSRAIAMAPLFDRGHAWRGTLQVRRGRHAQALGDLRQAARLNRDYPHTYYNLMRACVALGQWGRALRYARRAVERDRRDAWEGFLYDLEYASPALERSSRDFYALVERAPDAAWAWAWLGQTLLRAKKYEPSFPALDRAIALDPSDPWPWVWRGEARRRLGRCREAEADFARAAALDPACAWAAAGQGYCRLFKGDWKGALQELDRALRLTARCGRGMAHVWRGEALWRLGRGPEARRSFSAALAFYPRWRWVEEWARGKAPCGPVTEDARALLARGRSRLERGDCSGAIEDASRILEMNVHPMDRSAFLLRAAAKRIQADPAAAAEDLRRVRALDSLGAC